MEENQVFRDLEIDSDASANLMEASRWGKFLGILVLAGVGLLFLLMIFLWSRIGTLLTPADIDSDISPASAGNIVICAVVVILFVFLIKGATRIRNGLLNKDQYLFNSGLANLRNFFVMYGIIGIIQVFFALIGLLAR